MKKSGRWILRSLVKPNSPSHLREFCRRMSSLRMEARSRKSATVPAAESRSTKALQNDFAARPLEWPLDWWGNSTSQGTAAHSDSVYTRKAQHAWVHENYEGGYAGTIRVGKGEEASDFPTWRRICEEGQLSEAVGALDLLVQRGCLVHYTLLCDALKRSIVQKDLLLGKRLHALACQCGSELDTSVANQILRMYSSHGMLKEATEVFNKMAAPDLPLWSSIILAHAEHGQPLLAIELYRQMRKGNVKSNKYVFVAVLKACSISGDLGSGMEIHADFLRSDIPCHDIFVGSCLVDMYAKCGNLVDARKVFDELPMKNVVTWNSMISGYTLQGSGREALELYRAMRQEGITAANRVTFVCLLKACSSIAAVQEGKHLHAQIQERGIDADLVIGNSLVNMYAKCGSLQDARRVFDRLPKRDVVTWNSIITGYAQRGFFQEALTLYGRMQREEKSLPSYVTFLCLLQACASAGALHHGKQLHGQIRERGLENDVVVGNCLVEMYSKCGSLEDACNVLYNLPTRDVVTWTSLLNGFAEHSDCSMAIQCFEEMQREGIDPNHVTFACLLVACSHQGLLDEGRHYFDIMVNDYGLTPTLQHYNCMVDLLGRSGHLDEAENVLQAMPLQTDVVGWTTLLSACKSHGDLERGRRCFDHLMRLEPGNATPYSLLASLYAKFGRWRDVDRIETLRKSARAWKKAAKATIEVKMKLLEFTVGDETSDVSSKVKSVNERLKEEGGHVPRTELVMQPISDSQKEDALCGHAEKLALAYGLLNTPGGETLFVTKNLRMCSDCHSSTEILSLLEKREIIVRDAHRVHRFLNGSCSCGNWH